MRSANLHAEAFANDQATRQTVAYDLIMIAEALQGLPPEVQGLAPDIAWRLIRSMRNRLVHEGERTDWTIVLDVLKNKLPLLIESLSRLSDRIDRQDK
jgi:uncharacterized protein with HEPN domain